MLGRVVLIRTDVSEELSASLIRMTRIGELGTTLDVTSNRTSCEEIPRLRRFLQEPHDVTSQKTAFFIITALKTSNLTQNILRTLNPAVELATSL
jgi:hypothetical protein